LTDDYIESQGRAFLAHRLRRSSELILEQVGAVLVRKALSVPPRGASMLMLIDERAPIGVVEISRRLQLSHPLIVRMAQRFEALGLVTVERDPDDARRKRLVPTAKGRAEAAAVRRFNAALDAMFERLLGEIGCDLIAVLDRLDAALRTIPVEQRLSETQREDGDDR
jgi:DNA-binding MarR family transcriptional regulator